MLIQAPRMTFHELTDAATGTGAVPIAPAMTAILAISEIKPRDVVFDPSTAHPIPDDAAHIRRAPVASLRSGKRSEARPRRTSGHDHLHECHGLDLRGATLNPPMAPARVDRFPGGAIRRPLTILEETGRTLLRIAAAAIVP
jgi:hypothetical protein